MKLKERMDPKLAALMARRKQKQEDDGDAGYYMQNDDPPQQAHATNKEQATAVRGKKTLSIRRALQEVSLGRITITADFSFASQTCRRNGSQPADRVLLPTPRA